MRLISSANRMRRIWDGFDSLTVRLDIKKDIYVANFSNLGLTNVPIADEYQEKYDRLLCGGIWCIIQLEYEFVEEEKTNGNPVQIRKLTPIQMPHIEMSELSLEMRWRIKEQLKNWAAWSSIM